MALSLKAAGQDKSVNVDVLMPIACIGLAFHWACLFVGIYLPVSLPIFTVSQQELTRVFCFAGIAVGVLMIGAFADRLAGTAGRIRLAVLGVFLMLLCNVSLLLVYFGLVFPDPLMWIFWFGFGAGTSCGLMTWLDFLSHGNPKNSSSFIAAGVAIGGLICLGVAGLPPLPIIISLIALPILSCATLLFHYSRTELPLPVESKRSKERYTLSIMSSTTVGIYGVVFGLSQFMIFSEEPAPISPMVIGAAVIVGCFVLVLANTLNKQPVKFSTTQRVLFPLMVIVLLLIPFTGNVYLTLCWALLMAALTCFDTANMGALARTSHEYKLTSFYFISRGRLPIQIGMFTGWMLGYVLLRFHIISAGLMIFVVLGLVVLLVVIATIVPFEKSGFGTVLSDANGDNNRDGLGSWQLRCQEVSRKYELSSRQQDVLVFLAKGRNAEYIQKELVVSNHTAKTHIYQIYRKLGVHSQQELIDLVEQAKLPPRS